MKKYIEKGLVRKSGGTWLVTEQAMKEVFGEPKINGGGFSMKFNVPVVNEVRDNGKHIVFEGEISGSNNNNLRNFRLMSGEFRMSISKEDIVKWIENNGKASAIEGFFNEYFKGDDIFSNLSIYLGATQIISLTNIFIQNKWLDSEMSDI